MVGWLVGRLASCLLPPTTTEADCKEHAGQTLCVASLNLAAAYLRGRATGGTVTRGGGGLRTGVAYQYETSMFTMHLSAGALMRLEWGTATRFRPCVTVLVRHAGQGATSS